MCWQVVLRFVVSYSTVCMSHHLNHLISTLIINGNLIPINEACLLHTIVDIPAADDIVVHKTKNGCCKCDNDDVFTSASVFFYRE